MTAHESGDGTVGYANPFSNPVGRQSFVPVKPTHLFRAKRSKSTTFTKRVSSRAGSQLNTVTKHVFPDCARAHSDQLSDLPWRKLLIPVKPLKFSGPNRRDSSCVLGWLRCSQVFSQGNKSIAFNDAAGQKFGNDCPQVVDAPYVQEIADFSQRVLAILGLYSDSSDLHEVSDSFKSGEMGVAEVDVAMLSMGFLLVSTDRTFAIQKPSYVVPVHVDTVRPWSEVGSWQ